VKTQTEYLIAK